jgi:hypothetical protein
MVHTAKDEFRAYLIYPTRLPALSSSSRKTIRAWGIVNLQATMQPEFHSQPARMCPKNVAYFGLQLSE